jgi:hypothetical protein
MDWSNERHRRRFLGKIQKTSGCWIWLGGARGDGYGMFKSDGLEESAHRIAYEHLVGPIPDGFLVMHRCDVRRCVNPDHLLAGTSADNIADKISKGRQARGSRNGQAILTEEQAVAIRAEYRPWLVGYGALAKRYGVSRGAIKAVVSGRTWGHV